MFCVSSAGEAVAKRLIVYNTINSWFVAVPYHSATPGPENGFVGILFLAALAGASILT